jgi:hypothetical protein
MAVNPAGDVWVSGADISDDSSLTTIKYNTAGVTLWTQRLASAYPYGTDATGLAVDAIGNTYVTGMRDYSGVLVKYSSDGAELWVRSSEFLGRARALTLDASGNVIVAAPLSNPKGIFDVGVAKYDSAGNLLWLSRYDGEGLSDYQYPEAVTTDESGSIYAVGGRYLAGGVNAILTLKYTPGGSLAWAATYVAPPAEAVEGGRPEWT